MPDELRHGQKEVAPYIVLYQGAPEWSDAKTWGIYRLTSTKAIEKYRTKSRAVNRAYDMAIGRADCPGVIVCGRDLQFQRFMSNERFWEQLRMDWTHRPGEGPTIRDAMRA